MRWRLLPLGCSPSHSGSGLPSFFDLSLHSPAAPRKKNKSKGLTDNSAIFLVVSLDRVGHQAHQSNQRKDEERESGEKGS
jgi:hypothetical protein